MKDRAWGLNGAEARELEIRNLTTILEERLFPADRADQRSRQEKNKDNRRMLTLTRLVTKHINGGRMLQTVFLQGK
jgi:hypothetical protein